MAAVTSPNPFNQRKRLAVVQLLGVAVLGLLLFSRPGWNEASQVHEFVEMSGLALVLACIFGRLWSILYVGSVKNRCLVIGGPYSITRNPLYLFSTIGALGIGLLFGSVIVAALLGAFSFLVFRLTARKEAEFLRARFGAEYEAYAARTPLFFPDPRLYREAGDHTFSPKALATTFVDALYFLAAFPAIEALEYLQTTGHLPTLLRLF
jgi:protein-S-isoprenylcysteine O-methyltransferase Ste14